MISETQQKKKFQTVDMAILFIAILGFLLTFYALFFDPSFFGLLGNNVNKNGITIGRIVFAGDTTRKKVGGSFSWDYVNVGTPILLGDSLFTGKSPQTRVLLQEKNSLDLGANTLIHFVEIDGIRLPSLNEGNINLKVEGSLKVAIAGQITEIQGDNAQVQLFIQNGQKPQVRLLSGDAKIQTEDRKIIPLSRGQISQLELSQNIKRSIASDVIAPTDEVQAQETTAPVALPKYYKLYDVYQLVGNELRPSSQLDPQLNYLPQNPPIILGSRDPIPLENSQAVWTGKLNQENGYTNFVLETSTSPQFDQNVTRIDWHPKEEVLIRFDRPQRLYLRARAANSEFELTPLSESIELNVFEKPPVLAQEIPPTPPPQPRPTPKKKKKVEPLPEKSVAKSKPTPPRTRKPAAVPEPPAPLPEKTISLTMDKILESGNEAYDSSVLGFESSAYNMYSGFQAANRVDLAQPVLLGVSGRHWFGSSGVEAYYRSKVSSLNDQGSQVSPTIFDLRYHYRFGWGFNPFSSLKESQISFFLGYEMLRNQGTTLYRAQYDIFKGGVQFYFPMFRNWDTGGTLSAGRGMDGTLKYEITGHFHYFFRPRWSWGLGYRVHLYQSTKPGLVAGESYPANYREGNGEGYSVIRWHY